MAKLTKKERAQFDAVIESWFKTFPVNKDHATRLFDQCIALKEVLRALNELQQWHLDHIEKLRQYRQTA